ncbi:MAG: hypothetical protein MZV70_20305 [Desulfobacterales bacterium]|nr:hypothetical protein [Desulfobacterales bacterium]
MAGKALFDHAPARRGDGLRPRLRGVPPHAVQGRIRPGRHPAPSATTRRRATTSVPKRSDALHQQCIGCHTGIRGGPGRVRPVPRDVSECRCGEGLVYRPVQKGES